MAATLSRRWNGHAPSILECCPPDHPRSVALLLSAVGIQWSVLLSPELVLHDERHRVLSHLAARARCSLRPRQHPTPSGQFSQCIAAIIDVDRTHAACRALPPSRDRQHRGELSLEGLGVIFEVFSGTPGEFAWKDLFLSCLECIGYPFDQPIAAGYICWLRPRDRFAETTLHLRTQAEMWARRARPWPKEMFSPGNS